MSDTIESLQKIAKGTAKSANNGTVPALPPDRAAAVEYGLTQFQQIGHERDQVRAENAELRDKIAALHITNEGIISQLTEAVSQLKSAMLIRDQALANHLKYEALFISIQAQMRAFAVPSEPLIRDNDDTSVA